MLYICIDENGTILKHSYEETEECVVQIVTPPINVGGHPSLVDSNGDYAYKYIEGELVALSEQDINAHPRYKSQRLNILKEQVNRSIQALDELKAHSLMGKVAMGGELTQDENNFVSNFLTQRQAILDQYTLDKAVYE